MNTTDSKPLLTTIKQLASSGSFAAQDEKGNPLTLSWEKIDAQVPELNKKIVELTPLLVDIYTQQELRFAREYPQAVADQHFLKSLAPLFAKDNENVDWKMVKEKIRAIFQNFFTQTDFAQFSSPDETHLFVLAQNKDGATVGFVQFIANASFAQGSIKAGMMAGSGLEKLLLSSAFRLVPQAQNLFLHTRVTNYELLKQYHSWGFADTSSEGYWVNSTYDAHKHHILQNTAKTFMTS